MKKRRSFLLLGLLLGCLAASQGTEFWDKKEYREWSERECRKLLEDSPWARTYTLSRVLIEPLQTPSTERAREPHPQITYHVQFWSALPIRQALVRLQQIQQKYDRMTPAEQQAFDQQAEKFLAARFPDTVVLHVAYGSNVQVDDRELARHWQIQTTETLKNFVFLINSGGDKVPLLRYVSGGGARREFQLIFPREYEGRPLVGPEDKSLKLEFIHPRIGEQSESRVLIEFKVKKMLMRGAVVY